MATALEEQWSMFCSTKSSHAVPQPATTTACSSGEEVPTPTELYISTKTKIVYLDTGPLDLNEIFWRLPVIPYAKEANGVIKKQMKTTCHTLSEVAEIQKHVDFFVVDP